MVAVVVGGARGSDSRRMGGMSGRSSHFHRRLSAQAVDALFLER